MTLTDTLLRNKKFLILVGDVLLSLVIIHLYDFTNIDWQAYADQVRMVFVDGELNYGNIRGDSGPIAYPAGFLYAFRLIMWLTDNGTNIRVAQYIFAGILCLTNMIVFAIYSTIMPTLKKRAGISKRQSHVFELAIFLSLVASRRVHSIYLLRMFNDAVSMGLFYFSTLQLVHRRWFLGVIIYSLAVSVKMNVLFALPGVLLVSLAAHGLLQTVFHVFSIVALNGVIASPFLITHPWNYLSRSFDLTRRFLHRWTVNFQFIPKDVFEGKVFGSILLVCTLVTWAIVAYYWINQKGKGKKLLRGNVTLSSYDIVTLMFVFNFVGVVFARTLHYQFYVWFFHQLPFLLLIGDRPMYQRGLMFFLIDVCFTVYPATQVTSVVLMICFGILLNDILTSLRPPSDSVIRNLLDEFSPLKTRHKDIVLQPDDASVFRSIRDSKIEAKRLTPRKPANWRRKA